MTNSLDYPLSFNHTPLREPDEIIKEIIALDKESEGILANIRGMI